MKSVSCCKASGCLNFLIRVLKGFEVILADGSPTTILWNCFWICRQLSVAHLHKPRLPISPARNLRPNMQKGEYLIFLDSDVILRNIIWQHVHRSLQQRQGWRVRRSGCSRHQSFGDVQKAISFAMTSYPDTGGIRGGKNNFINTKSRGFNAGASAKLLFNKWTDFQHSWPVKILNWASAWLKPAWQ